MNNSQIEELEIGCDKMAEQQCRADDEQHLLRSALKENPQGQCLFMHIVLSPKLTFFF